MTEKSVATLCVVNLDIDCMIIPTSCCRTCIQVKLDYKILHEFNISADYLIKSNNLIRRMNTQCLCFNGFHGTKFNEIIKTKSHGYYGMHWIIARQVLRRRNRRMCTMYDYRVIEQWKFDYFDTVVADTDDINNPFLIIR